MKTLKLTFAVIVLGLFSIHSFAQVKVGVFTGIHKTNAKIEGLSASVLPQTHGKIYLPIGVVADYRLDKKFVLSSGLTYASKGFEISESTNIDLLGINLPVGVKANTTIHAIEIPLHIKYVLGNEKFSAYAMAGPRVNMNIDGEIRTFASTIVDIPLTRTDIDFGNRNFNRMTLGGDLGLGIESQYGSGAFFGEMLYQKDFGKSIHEETIQSGIKLDGVSLRLGFKMTL
jgi:hypothetical protein